MGTLNVVPSNLERTYGSRTPVGGLVFLRLRPRFGSSMAGMKGMHMDANLESRSALMFNARHRR
jgi:hypothetical protein